MTCTALPAVLPVVAAELVVTTSGHTRSAAHTDTDGVAVRVCTLCLVVSQLQFELRVVAGRDALRQALLAMVPQIDELQKKRELMKQQADQQGGGSGGVKTAGPPADMPLGEMPPLAGGHGAAAGAEASAVKTEVKLEGGSGGKGRLVPSEQAQAEARAAIEGTCWYALTRPSFSGRHLPTISP